MKFSAVFTTAILALAVNSQSPSSSASSPAPSQSLSPQQQCVIDKNCQGSINCLASCNNVPNPDNEQSQKTNKCVASCDNTKPIAEYSDCTQKCINGIFLDHPNSDGVATNDTQSGKNGTVKDNGNNSTNTTAKKSGISSDTKSLTGVFTIVVGFAIALCL